MTANEKLQDLLLERSLILERIKGSVSNDLTKVYDELLKNISKRINESDLTIKQSERLIKLLEKDKEILAKKLMDLEEENRRALMENDRIIEGYKLQISRFPAEKEALKKEFEKERQSLLNEINMLKSKISNESQRFEALEKQLRIL